MNVKDVNIQRENVRKRRKGRLFQTSGILRKIILGPDRLFHRGLSLLTLELVEYARFDRHFNVRIFLSQISQHAIE